MAGYNGRPAFTATVHEPGDAPARFWRLITLRYPDGHEAGIAYTGPPADSGELPALMWSLQTAAARYGFRVTVTTVDGTTTQAPPILAKRAKAGGQ